MRPREGMASMLGASQGIASAPSLTGDHDADKTVLRDFLGKGEELLSGLPAPAGRSAAQASLAQDIHRASRQARMRFMTAHGQRVHDELTAGQRIGPRLSELTAAAASRYPGLVPARGQLAQESGRWQADKEGREIDQGIFVRGLLSQPVAGAAVIRAMLRPTDRAQDLLAGFRRRGEIELATVSVARQGTAALLTIQNGEFLNAEDDQLADDLEVAVDLALLDDQVRVGVLRGGTMSHPRYAGRRVFCSGINLSHLHQGKISFLRFLIGRELGFINKMKRGLAADDEDWMPEAVAEKPWIAAVDAFAIGGGMQILLVCDHIIAASDAWFSLPAAREGIVPGVANLRLTQLMGGRLTRQLILGEKRIEAADPEAALICDEVAASADMEAAIEASVARLGTSAVVPNRRMINLAEEPLDCFRVYMAQFALEQARRLYDPEVLANVAARWLARSRRTA